MEWLENQWRASKSQSSHSEMKVSVFAYGRVCDWLFYKIWEIARKITSQLEEAIHYLKNRPELLFQEFYNLDVIERLLSKLKEENEQTQKASTTISAQRPNNFAAIVHNLKTDETTLRVPQLQALIALQKHFQKNSPEGLEHSSLQVLSLLLHGHNHHIRRKRSYCNSFTVSTTSSFWKLTRRILLPSRN